MAQNNALGGGPPTGGASGDLNGFYPNPSVIKINGNAINSTVLSSTQDGYVLTWVNGSSEFQAKPATGGGGGSFTAGGDLTGSSSSQTVIKINGNAVSSTALSATQDGYVLTWVNGSSNYQAVRIPTQTATGTASGDLSGTFPYPTLAKLQGKTLSSSLASVGASQDGYALTWDNTDGYWYAKAIASSGGSSTPAPYSLSGNLTLSSSYYVVFVNTSAARSITLPVPANGTSFVLKDVSGLAETNNISLIRNGSEKIEGVAATRLLTTNWGVWYINSNGTDWFLL